MYRILLHSLNWRRQGFSCSPFFFYTENLPHTAVCRFSVPSYSAFISPQFWHWSAFRASSTTARMSRCISSPLQASLPISKMPV